MTSILFFGFFTIFLPKPFNPPRGIEEFLFPSEKGMTVGANFNMDLFFSALRLKGRPTGTFDNRVKNLRMDVLLHLSLQNSILPIFP